MVSEFTETQRAALDALVASRRLETVPTISYAACQTPNAPSPGVESDVTRPLPGRRPGDDLIDSGWGRS